jgi:hypothetical protein
MKRARKKKGRGSRLLKAYLKKNKLMGVWNNAPAGYLPGPPVGKLKKDPNYKRPSR